MVWKIEQPNQRKFKLNDLKIWAAECDSINCLKIFAAETSLRKFKLTDLFKSLNIRVWFNTNLIQNLEVVYEKIHTYWLENLSSLIWFKSYLFENLGSRVWFDSNFFLHVFAAESEKIQTCLFEKIWSRVWSNPYVNNSLKI